MLGNDDMRTRPRWQSLLLVFLLIFGLLMIPLLVVNQWIDVPPTMLFLFGALVSGLIINKFFARKIF